MSDDFLIVPPQYEAAVAVAAASITEAYGVWERGEGASPDDRDNISACIIALDASGVPWPGYSEDGFAFLCEELFERHSQGDWESSEPIARWVIARLVQGSDLGTPSLITVAGNAYAAVYPGMVEGKRYARLITGHEADGWINQGVPYKSELEEGPDLDAVSAAL